MWDRIHEGPAEHIVLLRYGPVLFPLPSLLALQQPVHPFTERCQFVIPGYVQEFPVPGLEDHFASPHAGGRFYPADFFEGNGSRFRGNEGIPGQEEAVPCRSSYGLVAKDKDILRIQPIALGITGQGIGQLLGRDIGGTVQIGMGFTGQRCQLLHKGQEGCPVTEVMRQREILLGETTAEIVDQRMDRVLEIMKDAAFSPIKDPVISMGGLIGGEARRLCEFHDLGKSLCGNVLGKGITYAMATLETNASMGLIVASPTAGSAGIVPGMMLALQEVYGFSDKKIRQALFNAGAIGYLAMRNATVAGAVGGCQAEVGIASAMAASAAVELLGGTPLQCTYAASTVLMNMLGLVCDPVGGLVEYPCQNRNAAGVSNALIAAEMSLAGIPQFIPLDEMIDAMYTVGKKLPAELRETALGGCAATPSACEKCHLCS